MTSGEDSADRSRDDTIVITGFVSGAFFAERYRLERLLGAGAMGKVYAATDMANDSQVALKVLHPDKARKTKVLARFRREAEILGNLGHPGIVRVIDSGQSQDGTDFISMELLEGRSLKQKLREDGPYTAEAWLPILIMVCDAMAAAHDQGVVHRDLKPDNIYLVETTDPPTAKIVDFGLSRPGTLDRMTKTGVMLGTPRYMAPEQIRSAKDSDSRSDIYACGVITYEALIGASPFAAEDAGQLLGCVIENKIVPMEDQRPDIPPSIPPVVYRAMAKDRKDRFATAGAFAEAFATAIGQTTGRSSLVGRTDALFAGVEASQSYQAPVELPPEHAGEPRFTVPTVRDDDPTLFNDLSANAPTEEEKKRKTRSRFAWAAFALALMLVVCLSAAGALALRAWLSGSFP